MSKGLQKDIQGRENHSDTHVHIPVHTIVFSMLFLLAGFLRTLSGEVPPFWESVVFVLQYSIYFGLILYWILSVRVRLLPSKSRRYIMIAGTQMIFFLLVQVIKYRIVPEENAFGLRMCWYFYYLPFTMIPVMFLLSGLGIYESIGTPVRFRRRKIFVGVVYGITILLIAFVLTNDQTGLVFHRKPGQDLVSFSGLTGTYTYGLLFYVLIGWVVGCMAFGLALLINLSRRTGSHKDVMQILAFPALWVIMNITRVLLDETGFAYPYQFPHIHVFCMIGMFEACIRNRLMPCNEEDYPSFFAGMKVPAVISDYDLNPVFCTGEKLPEEASSEVLRNSLESSVRLKESQSTVYGRKLSNSLVFWTADESTVNRLNDQLKSACEELAGENELIDAQNRLSEKRARVEVRNKIYAGVSKRMAPAMKRLSVLLDRCEEDLNRGDEERFRERMSRALVFTAFIKRASNLMLADPGEEIISGRELYLALEESARYLSYCGITLQISSFSATVMDREVAFSLYTALEKWVEICFELNAVPKRMSLACSEREIRLMAPEVHPFPDPEKMEKGRAKIKMERSEGLIFLSIRVPEEEEEVTQ